MGAATLVIVYLVILAGSIVRATGSGMGCPDWPKCFGSWVPPTHVSQLPADYQTRYAIPGHVPVFNASKTWVEYVNRLLGVLTGIFIFGTLVTSAAYWRTNRTIVWVSLAAFLLVGLQGWLGAKVVSTVLAPWMITVHMLMALLIVCLLVYAVAWPQITPTTMQPNKRDWFAYAFIAAFATTLIQIVYGILVRQHVDAAALQLGEDARDQWLAGSKWFYVHRTFAWLFVVNAAVVFFFMRKYGLLGTLIARFFYASVGIVALNVLMGVLLSYAGFPAFAQPLHLLGAAVLLGVYLLLFLLIIKKPVLQPAANASTQAFVYNA
jgi:cytochrome c oxidase assembly protein subunit 15